jgi:DNA polymerase III epsilon subunit-like protein
VNIASLDTETGGLDPQKNGLISIAIIAPNQKKFHQIISPNPNLTYDQHALEINGFQIHKTKNKSQWVRKTKKGELQTQESLPEPTVIRNLITFLRNNCRNTYFAGCNIAFDKAFLLAAAKRTDKKPFLIDFFTPSQEHTEAILKNEFLHRTYELQTLALFLHQTQLHRLPPNRKNPTIPSTSLDSICMSLNIQKEKRKNHDALEDATLTLLCLKKLTEKIQKHPATPSPNLKSTPPSNPSAQTPTDIFKKLLKGFSSNRSLEFDEEFQPFLNKNGYIKKTVYKKFSTEQKKIITPLVYKALNKKEKDTAVAVSQ